MKLNRFSRFGRAAIVSASALTFAGTATAQNAPGQFTPDANAPIQLHMPVHLHLPPRPKRALKRKQAPVERAVEAPARSANATPIDAAERGGNSQSRASVLPSHSAHPNTDAGPARDQRRNAVREVLSAPANASSSSQAVGDVSAPDAAIPFSFDSATSAPAGSAKAAPPPKVALQRARAAQEPRGGGKPKAGSIERDEKDLAALTPLPKETPPSAKPKGDPHAGLTKQSEVLFDGASTDPQTEGASAVKSSTDKLNAALDKGAANVEIEAYGGALGDRSSEARRLSLRRALAVRQLLIDGGVPANRIVVKAMGGADPGGNGQRVDIYLRGAS